MLSRVNRLKGKANFDIVFKKGEKFFSPYFVLYTLDSKSPEQPVRIGIITSKKVGEAVVRNHARRMLSEALRQLLPLLNPGLTLVFVVLAKFPPTGLPEISKNLQETLGKAGNINSQPTSQI